MKYTVCLLLAVAQFCGCLYSGDLPVTANNVVVLLDASGSMASGMRNASITKMEAAKQALKSTLTQIPADTQVGLLVFGAQNSQGWRFPLGERNDAQIIRAIDGTSPGGGTPLGEYILKATQALMTQRTKQMGYGSYRLLIVTDGEAGDAQLLEKVVPAALRSGIRLDVIGVDMTSAHTLATKVHSYRRADDPNALKKAVADIFAEVGGASSDSTGDGAFALLAPIPVETAQQMITALGKEVPLSNVTSSLNNGVKDSSHTQTSSNMTVKSNVLTSVLRYFMYFVIAGIIFARLFGKRRRR